MPVQHLHPRFLSSSPAVATRRALPPDRQELVPPRTARSRRWGALTRALAGLALALIAGCARREAVSEVSGNDLRAGERDEMVRTQIAARGIRDPAVLDAMRAVPRHRFVPDAFAAHAYADTALPIGEEQTISQPYIVALMTELARLQPGQRVLEVGTGSGYQAAVLEALGAEVFTIEIVPPLARRAREILEAHGSSRIRFRIGDGYRGWPEAAPFDAILVTAAPAEVPQPLVDQLKIGGRLVIPVGQVWQNLVVITRTPDGIHRDEITPVRFVPMTGEAERSPP